MKPEINPLRPIPLIENNPLKMDLTLRVFRKCKLRNSIIIDRDGEKPISQTKKWHAGEQPPVLILLGLKLPKYNDLKVLKHRSEYRSLPFTVLTTSKEDKNIDAAYSLGANSHIHLSLDYRKFYYIAEHIESYGFKTNMLSR
jgi:CheY-like chemotaxis protein